MSSRRPNQRPGAGWTEWTWSQEHQQYFRQRLDPQGNVVEYDYSQTTPRGNTVNDLTAGFSGVSIHDPYDQDASFTQDAAHGGNEAYTYGPTIAGDSTQAYAAAPWQDQATSSSRSKGNSLDASTKPRPKNNREKNRDGTKDKGLLPKKPRSKPGKGQGSDQYVDLSPDPFYSHSQQPRAKPTVTSGSGNLEPSSEYSTGFQYPESPYGLPESASGFETGSAALPQSSIGYQDNYGSAHVDEPYPVQLSVGGDEIKYPYHGEQYPQTSHTDAQQSTPEDPQPGSYTAKEAIIEDQASASSYNTTQEPSADQESTTESEYDAEQPSGYEVGGAYTHEESSSMATSYDYGTYPGYEEDTGQTTPRASSPVGGVANTYRYAANPTTGNPGFWQEAELDDRYVVEPSSKFAPGEVFKVLWTEPLGAGRNENMTDVEVRSVMGQRFYHGFRRFIVVANDEGHCTCIPILTYERRACTKRGVKPQKHGVVYDVRARPRMLEGEPQLGFDPVQLELYYGTESLAKESRVNYSKLVTVEHNIKVFFIGRIVPDDFSAVTAAVDKCWTDKNRQGTEQQPHHRSSRHHNNNHRRR